MPITQSCVWIFGVNSWDRCAAYTMDRQGIKLLDASSNFNSLGKYVGNPVVNTTNSIIYLAEPYHFTVRDMWMPAASNNSIYKWDGLNGVWLGGTIQPQGSFPTYPYIHGYDIDISRQYLYVVAGNDFIAETPQGKQAILIVYDVSGGGASIVGWTSLTAGSAGSPTYDSYTDKVYVPFYADNSVDIVTVSPLSKANQIISGLAIDNHVKVHIAGQGTRMLFGALNTVYGLVEYKNIVNMTTWTFIGNVSIGATPNHGRFVHPIKDAAATGTNIIFYVMGDLTAATRNYCGNLWDIQGSGNTVEGLNLGTILSLDVLAVPEVGTSETLVFLPVGYGGYDPAVFSKIRVHPSVGLIYWGTTAVVGTTGQMAYVPIAASQTKSFDMRQTITQVSATKQFDMKQTVTTGIITKQFDMRQNITSPTQKQFDMKQTISRVGVTKQFDMRQNIQSPEAAGSTSYTLPISLDIIEETLLNAEMMMLESKINIPCAAVGNEPFNPP